MDERDMEMTSGKEWYKDGQCCDKLRLWMLDPKFADHSATAPHPLPFISPIRKLQRVRPKDHRLWQARHNVEPTDPAPRKTPTDRQERRPVSSPTKCQIQGRGIRPYIPRCCLLAAAAQADSMGEYYFYFRCTMSM